MFSIMLNNYSAFSEIHVQQKYKQMSSDKTIDILKYETKKNWIYCFQGSPGHLPAWKSDTV